MLDEADRSSTADARGKIFEELLKYVFESVPNSLVIGDVRTHLKSEQVDLAVSNGGAFRGLPEAFLVECKNYSEPLDSKSVGYFLFISLARRAELAIIAAAEGLSGDAQESTYAHSLALTAAPMGCRLIVLTRADLIALKSWQDLVALLQRRFLKAFASGGVGID